MSNTPKTGMAQALRDLRIGESKDWPISEYYRITAAFRRLRLQEGKSYQIRSSRETSTATATRIA